MSPPKIEYSIDLTRPIDGVRVGGLLVRPIAHDDVNRLASLMLDAYMGTIDYDGETLEDALRETRSFFAGTPMLDHSRVAGFGDEAASAIMLSRRDGQPFVGYVMSAAAHKGRGLARAVAADALAGLRAAGFSRAGLFITEGNVPSEALFRRLGAVRVSNI